MIRIYTLINPITEQVFYVGASKDIETNIISRHMSNSAHFGTRKELRKNGLKPLIDFIDESNEPMEAARLEEYWIWQFRTWGFIIENKRLCSGYVGSSRAIYSKHWWRIVKDFSAA
jgi:hypothetical protein